MTVDELLAQERAKVAKYLRRDQAAQYLRSQMDFLVQPPCSINLPPWAAARSIAGLTVFRFMREKTLRHGLRLGSAGR